MSAHQPAVADAGRTNPLAVVALVTAFLLPVAGIVTGHLALAEIRRSGGRGRELALAGTVVGYLLAASWLVVGLGAVAFVVLTLGALSLAGPAGPLPIP